MIGRITTFWAIVPLLLAAPGALFGGTVARLVQTTSPPGAFADCGFAEPPPEDLSAGTTATTVLAPPECGSRRFTRWAVNATSGGADLFDCPGGPPCRETSTGRALNPARFTILEDVTATAHYVDAELDSDTDGLPDWYELRLIGDLSADASSDPDGDGYLLGEEYALDFDPYLVDLQDAGGRSARSGRLAPIILLQDHFFYLERSDPVGLFESIDVLPLNAPIQTPAFESAVAGRLFGYWDLNDVEQRDALGQALSRLSFLITTDSTATAHFFLPTLDTDADGIPDWFELRRLGDRLSDGTSDPDGDGLTVEREYLLDLSPLQFDQWVAGGISARTGGLSRLSLEVLYDYLITSQPMGLVTACSEAPMASCSGSVLSGTEVTTPAIGPGELRGGFFFSNWTLDGARQVDVVGIPRPQLVFQVLADSTATAMFDPDGDGDADGLPDWYESAYFLGSANPTDDPDGDSLTVAREQRDDFSPLLFDRLAQGGLSARLGPSESVDLRAFPRVSRVLVNGLPNDFFSTATDQIGSLAITADSAPVLLDWDANGTQDLFVAGAMGALGVYVNRGSPVIADLHDRPLVATALAGFLAGLDAPVLAGGDFNGDGLEDLVIGGDSGMLRLVASTGHFDDVQSPPLDLLLDTGQSGAVPILVDVNADDRLDLLAVFPDGSSLTYLHNGSPMAPYSAASTRSDVLPVNVPSAVSGASGDISEDGIVDVILSDANGNIWEFHGTGSSNFNLVSKIFAGSFDGFANRLAASLGDLDGDGDADVFAGFAEGGVFYLRNQVDKLALDPPVRTLLAGGSLQFEDLDDSPGLTFGFIENRSGGSLTPSGFYTAGATPGVVDIIEARRGSDGVIGRSYVNVISAAQQTAVGKAIIVAAGKGPNDPAWPAANVLSRQAYRTLLHRGYTKENIQFLSLDVNQDADGNGLLDDIDAPSDLLNLEDSFVNWVGNASNLVVYFVDHGTALLDGSDALFRLNETERVSAVLVNQWVTALQDDVGTDVTLILEFCYAGNFRERLTYTPIVAENPPQRVTIAATDNDQLTYFISDGQVSFSNSFFNAVFQGFDLNRALGLGRTAISLFQSPTLDDNGDGLSDGNDGLIASATVIGAQAVVGQDIPVIDTISDPVTLIDTAQYTLFVDDFTSVYAIDRAWCTIVAPGAGFDPGSIDDSDGDGIVDLNPVVNVAEVELEFSFARQRYEATIDVFSEPGIHQITCRVSDVFGSVSYPRQTFVNQTSYVDKLLLVLGGDSLDPGFAAIEPLSSLVFGTALQRSYTTDLIRVLHPDQDKDLNGDGSDDVFAVPSSMAIEDAMTSWALDADRLTIFLIAATGQDTYDVDGSTALTPDDLDLWLDALQMGPEQTEVQMVLEYPGAGSFIDPGRLPPPGATRMAMAASSSGESNVICSSDGARYYLDELVPRLGEGQSMGVAHTRARAQVLNESKGLQAPLLDVIDNGNGSVDPLDFGVPNGFDDTLLSRERYLGGGGVTGEDRPFIGGPMDDVNLPGLQPVTLFAEAVQSNTDIATVVARVTPPDYAGGCGIDQLTLTYNEETNRWEGEYAGVDQIGDYRIAFVAEDITGNRSLAANSTVTAGGVQRTVSVAETERTISESSGATAIMVEMSTVHSEPVVVPFTLSGSASGGLDYAVSDTRFTVLAGESTATVDLVPVDDPQVETTETIVLTLKSPEAGADLGAPVVMTVTLEDNDVLSEVVFIDGFE